MRSIRTDPGTEWNSAYRAVRDGFFGRKGVFQLEGESSFPRGQKP